MSCACLQVTGIPPDTHPDELSEHFAAASGGLIADCVVAGDNRRMIANWVKRGVYVRRLDVRARDMPRGAACLT